MSRIVLVCLRSPLAHQLARARRRVDAFLATLRPDHLPEAPAVVTADGRGLFVGVFNPADDGAVHGLAAYAGWLLDGHEQWPQPDTAAPDGTYGLVRADEQVVELVADAIASRTLWTACTDEIFVASTSQRAIPWFLGGYEPHTGAAAWMLGHGSLGPAGAWDRRAQAVPPGGVLRLDRQRWRVTRRDATPAAPLDPAPDAVHAERLRAALDATFGAARFDWDKWVLPLSGGVDCRAILLSLRDRSATRTITWGRRAARSIPGNDAFVAREVAAALGVPNEYFEIDTAPDAPERVLARFLQAGDGRLDHVAAYLDGFALWRALHAAGVRGIVRGDQPFGMQRVADAAEVRARLEIYSWSELPGLPTFAALGLDHLREPLVPAELQQRPQESAEDWVHRGLLAYRALDAWAPLNDLKAPYVEIASPLLTRRIVEVARAMPGHLRTGKRLFRDLVMPLNPSIGYATDRAIAYPADALASPAMTELLGDAMGSRSVRQHLSPAFADFVSSRLAQRPRRRLGAAVRAWARRSLAGRLPRSLRAALRTPVSVSAPGARQLALRAYLIATMGDRLAADGADAG